MEPPLRIDWPFRTLPLLSLLSRQNIDRNTAAFEGSKGATRSNWPMNACILLGVKQHRVAFFRVDCFKLTQLYKQKRALIA
jgi:hypothetical protein